MSDAGRASVNLIIIFNLGIHVNTLKIHLRNCHPSNYNAVMAEESANRKKQEERKVLNAL